MIRTMKARLGLLALGFAMLTGAAYGGYAYSAMTVTGATKITTQFTETASTTFPTVSLSATPSFGLDVTYAAGTGNNQVDKKWCERRTIAASGADTLDLASGNLSNEYGVTQTFVKVKSFTVKADSTNTNDVWIGGAAANRFNTFLKDSSVVIVRPGFAIGLAGRGTGYIVTAATGDKLLFKNSSSGTGVTLNICLGGTST